MKGAIAGGCQLTVDAGIHALSIGGNAVDAAIASTLMAGVAEPILTGLGGAGMATIRFNGQTQNCDFFADMPGLGSPGSAPASMEKVSVDYGPTTQDFLVGPGSTTVPGVPAGLWAMHERYGTIDMIDLARPAIEAANNGFPVNRSFARVCELLWNILSRTEASRTLFSPNGHRLREGEIFRFPDLGHTLERFAIEGDSYFRTGDGSAAFLEHLDGKSLISQQDFENQRPTFRDAVPAKYRDSTLWVPGPPSAAGIGVAHTLAQLETAGQAVGATDLQIVRRMEHALRSTVSMRTKAFFEDLFSDGFSPIFMARVQAMRNGTPVPSAGFTTHISTVDEQGNAVAITHSLGETAGELVSNTGVVLNNFLGEADVNPPFLRRPAGFRLITMCCPSILETADGRLVAMGSGGSSRIPTAVVHGAMYMVDHDWSVDAAVRGPRTHVEAGRLHVESDGRDEGTMKEAGEIWPDFVRFDGPNLYFGGLHAAGLGPNGFCGAGDSRRSGAFGVHE